jgi:hypothetical protein
MRSELAILKLTTLLVATTLFSGCEGETGPQGAIGPTGPPYDRAASYCVQGSGVSASSGWSVSITCAQVSDIPIAASCYAPDVPPGGFLAASRAVDWSDTAKAAGWRCTWAWQPGAEPTGVGFSFGGTAEICCATQP